MYTISPKNPSDKIDTVKRIFKNSGAAEATQKEITKYTQKANDVLEQIDISEKKKTELREFGEWLMKRTF